MNTLSPLCNPKSDFFCHHILLVIMRNLVKLLPTPCKKKKLYALQFNLSFSFITAKYVKKVAPLCNLSVFDVLCVNSAFYQIMYRYKVAIGILELKKKKNQRWNFICQT